MRHAHSTSTTSSARAASAGRAAGGQRRSGRRRRYGRAAAGRAGARAHRPSSAPIATSLLGSHQHQSPFSHHQSPPGVGIASTGGQRPRGPGVRQPGRARSGRPPTAAGAGRRHGPAAQRRSAAAGAIAATPSNRSTAPLPLASTALLPSLSPADRHTIRYGAGRQAGRHFIPSTSPPTLPTFYHQRHGVSGRFNQANNIYAIC